MITGRLLRFGPFEVDVRTGELHKSGARIRLPEQSFQILLMLLDHPDELVLRSEIRQRLWPGDTVVEFDQSINAAVKRLRNALGESADTPRYIETVAKRGYRFIAEVRAAGQSPHEPSASAESHFRLSEKLAEGPGGVVYRAEDLNLGRQVAVNFPSETEGEPSESALLEIESEARAAWSLNHPHICTTYGVEDFGGRQGIVTELVLGETLGTRLSRGPLPLRDALRISLETASALAEAHGAGIAHRNLRPSNIMLTKNGVKVMDFGLARTVNEQDGNHGVLKYHSPEQRQGEAGDARSDIFSLGLVFYEMLSGRLAPAGAGKEQLSDVPAAGGQFLVRCLAREPKERWQSATEAKAELERLRDLEPVAARARGPAWPWLVAAVAGAVAIAAGVYSPFGGRTQSPLMRPVPLTMLTGQQTFPSFSPDGEKVAFSWAGPAKADLYPRMNIYVKSVLSGETVPVTSGPANDLYPTWSPDGSEIGFERVAPNGSDLMIVPSGGGAERKIADAGVGFAWSPDGTEIAYVAPYAPAGNGGILVRSLKTAQVRQLTSPQPNWERWLAWSPDGKQIAFSRNIRTPLRSVRELFVVPSRGGDARQLTFEQQSTGGFSWTPDSRDLVFDSSRDSGRNLWRIAVGGGTPERVALTANHPVFPSVSLHGNRLAYADSFVDSNIWKYELGGPSRGGNSLPQRPKCVICSSVEDDTPRFSPDGARIVFVSRRTGAEEIWTANTDGSSPKKLTSLESRSGSPRWSPDGRWIAFDSRASGNSDVYVISSTGGTPRLLTPEPSLEIEPSWSLDGRWIYFVSDRGGQSHIWKAPFEGGPARQVTQGDGGESLESADGKRLYYFRREHSDGIWSIPLETGLEEPVAELSGVVRTRAWTVRAEGIYFYQVLDTQAVVRFFSFATRQFSTLLTPERPTLSGNPGLDISPDGRTVLYTQVDNRVDELMMLENFR